jgi:hypothetical protein
MIVNPEIERYLDSLLPARDPVLQEMESEAARRNIPIIGTGGGARACAVGHDKQSQANL